MKSYCAVGFGNNFFLPLGSDALTVPSHLVSDEDGISGSNIAVGAVNGSDESKPSAVDNGIPSIGGTDTSYASSSSSAVQVSLLQLSPNSDHSNQSHLPENNASFLSAKEWLQSQLQLDKNDKNRPNHDKYTTDTLPLASCGATHTSFILSKHNNNNSSSTSGEAHLVGTVFGHTYHKLTVQPTRLPLKIVRISSGRRHVLALTEGAAPLSGSGSGTSSSKGNGGGGVVMSWGAGHFGQLGHGPDLTSCLEPRIVERLLPHVVGGQVVEIAAGGLHSAAIVASLSTVHQKVIGSGGGGDASASEHGESAKGPIVVRETRTFAWGSNRKGQCGIEGGKCATVPAPLPVVPVKRGEDSSKRDTAPVDKEVHFEKLSLGRLHTVALTAYGEVFSWGSTSMGRCGHNSMDSGRAADRRICQEPRFVSALRNVVVESIAAGDAHTLALSKNGRVFAWGAGSDGQCGQGHAGNLFSPRAVQELYFTSASADTNANESQSAQSNDTSESDGDMPRVNSKVALEVTMEEEALTRALSTRDTIKVEDEGEPTKKSETTISAIRKDGKVVKIRAAGNYSAAVTSYGDVYTWGYAAGVALGHGIPSDASTLPLLPLLEGNQYSYSTAAKVYPEGGSEENIIRDCRSFDTDLNVMLPRRVECIYQLGLHAEDVSLGPGHMVIVCSTESVHGDTNGPQSCQLDDDEQCNGRRVSDASLEQVGAATSVDALGSLGYAGAGSGAAVTASRTSTLGDVASVTTYESVESIDGKNERRRHGWMPKIKSRSNRDNSTPPSESTVASTAANGKEKKKSFIKILDVAFHRSGGGK